MQKRFVLSDQSKNSHGFKVNMDTIKLERFKKHPVMLYNHKELVGKWEDLKLEGGVLTGVPVFMSGKGEELAEQLAKRVADGFLNAASLGITVLSVTNEDDCPLVDSDVFEASIVDIPSNENALGFYDIEGEQLNGDALDFQLSSIQIPFKQPQSMKLSTETYTKLGVKEGATDDEVNSAVATLSKKNDDLQKELDDHNKAKVAALLSGALTDGKITADEKGTFESLAAADFELAEKTIAKIAGKKKLSGKENSTGDSRKDWTYSDWRKKDTAGLLAMKANDTEQYTLLLNAKN